MIHPHRSTNRDVILQWIRRLRPIIYLACALALLEDLTHSDTLAFGLFYIPLAGC